MRQIILDTETTGLDYKLGHRIVELAAVELSNRQFTGNNFHYYLNPQRESDEGALQVHGLTTEFLRDKPKFHEIVKDFLNFIQDAELIIHNAPFDVGFLNSELSLIHLPTLDTHCSMITDTLKLAKELHPGKRNNLDALCERYAIDNSKRTLHGALLDAELLAEVYLAMTRGQNSLMMEFESVEMTEFSVKSITHFNPKIIFASEDECLQHEQVLNAIDKAGGGSCIWRKRAEQD